MHHTSTSPGDVFSRHQAWNSSKLFCLLRSISGQPNVATAIHIVARQQKEYGQERRSAQERMQSMAVMAGATGLEPAASGVTGRRSNQLSYAPKTTIHRRALVRPAPLLSQADSIAFNQVVISTCRDHPKRKSWRTFQAVLSVV